MIFNNNYFVENLLKVASEKISSQPAKIKYNNANLLFLLNAQINCYPRFKTKSKINLLLPFSINSRSSATTFHSLLTNLFLYILLFAYHAVLDSVLLFHITGPPNPISEGGRYKVGTCK